MPKTLKVPEIEEKPLGSETTVNPVKIAHALSDPVRYRIMQLLAARHTTKCCHLDPADPLPEGLCICDLVAALGLIQSRVSYHMRELAAAGLVKEEPRGRWRYYTINRTVLQLYLRQLQNELLSPEDRADTGRSDDEQR